MLLLVYTAVLPGHLGADAQKGPHSDLGAREPRRQTDLKRRNDFICEQANPRFSVLV